MALGQQGHRRRQQEYVPHGQAASEPCLNGCRLRLEGWGQPGGVLAPLRTRKSVGEGRASPPPGTERPRLGRVVWSRLCRPLTRQPSPAQTEASGCSLGSWHPP